MEKTKGDRRIRLIAVDMDGTCVDNRKLVPEKNLWALSEAMKAGIVVVPATGRAIEGYPVAVRKLPGIRYMISSNGARVTDLKTGRDIRRVLLPCRDVADFLSGLRGSAVWVAVHMDGGCIDGNLIPFIHRKLFYHGDFKGSRLIPGLDRFLRRSRMKGSSPAGGKENRSGGVEKIQVFFLSKAAKKRTLALLKNWPRFSCALSHRFYVEITAAGASKGEALSGLCRYLDIPPARVMALGDSDNDLSMLRCAGYPVAMGNAEPAVKAAAKKVTAKNTQCGVAMAVMEAVREG